MKRLNNDSILQMFEGTNAYQHHKKAYTQGLKNPSFESDRRLPPFQIIGIPDPVDNVELIRIETGVQTNLYNALGNPSGLPGLESVEVESGVYNVVYMPTLQFSTPATPVGEYEFIVSCGPTLYYSERFRIVPDIDCFIKLQWWNNVNLPVSGGVIVYENGFKNHHYIDGFLTKPEYITIDIVEERDGVTFPIYQIWKKVMFLDIRATEAQADVLTKVGLHHNKYVTYQGEEYRILYFVAPSPTWEDQADFCTIECRLELGIVTSITGDSSVLAEFNDDFGHDFTT